MTMKKTQEQISVSNWSNDEKSFRSERDDILANLDAQEVAAAPFVFSDRQLMSSVLTRIEMFQKILNVQGSIVECGVHKGNSLFLYYHLSTILEPFGFNRKIIGFDTFDGFRSLSDHDHSNLSQSDFSDTSVDMLSRMASLHDKNRAVPHIEKIELVEGDACETIPKYVEENPHLIIAMLYLDFDIYEPTSVALKELLPLVPKGGLVGFDEVNAKKWSGETVALKEHLSLSGISLQKFYYDPWVSYYIVD
jgi:hypothetical protein